MVLTLLKNPLFLLSIGAALYAHFALLDAQAIPFPNGERSKLEEKMRLETRRKAPIDINGVTVKQLLLLSENNERDRPISKHLIINIISPVASNNATIKVDQSELMMVYFEKLARGRQLVCERSIPRIWTEDNKNKCASWKWSPPPIGGIHTDIPVPETGSVARFWLKKIAPRQRSTRIENRHNRYEALDSQVLDRDSNSPSSDAAANGISRSATHMNEFHGKKCINEISICTPTYLKQLVYLQKGHKESQEYYQLLLSGTINNLDKPIHAVDIPASLGLVGKTVLVTGGMNGSGGTNLKEGSEIAADSSDRSHPVYNSLEVYNKLKIGDYVYLSCTVTSINMETCGLDAIGGEPAISITRPSWWPLDK